MPVAPFDGTVVDIVSSLYLADGTVVPCFVLVSLGFALKKLIISSTSALPMRCSVVHIVQYTGTMQSTLIRFNELTSRHEEMHIICQKNVGQICTVTSKNLSTNIS